MRLYMNVHVFISVCQCHSLNLCLSLWLSDVCQPVHESICLCLSVCLSVSLCVCVSVRLSVSVCLSVSVSVSIPLSLSLAFFFPLSLSLWVSLYSLLCKYGMKQLIWIYITYTKYKTFFCERGVVLYTSCFHWSQPLCLFSGKIASKETQIMKISQA